MYVAIQIMPNPLSTIIAGYNANTSKIYKILSLLWQQRMVNIVNAKVGIKFCRYYYKVFALYPAMMVDNDQMEIKHDLYDYILYILLVFVLYPAMMVDNDYRDKPLLADT